MKFGLISALLIQTLKGGRKKKIINSSHACTCGHIIAYIRTDIYIGSIYVYRQFMYNI